MNYEILKLIAFLIGIYALIKAFSDRKNPFIRIITADLNAKGFKFASSNIPKTGWLPDFQADKPRAFPASAQGAITMSSYPVARDVTFYDSNNELQKARAIIHFKGMLSYKVKRIDWVPDIINLQTT